MRWYPPDVTSATEAGLRRTWPQRLLLVFGVVFAASLVYVTARLDQFEDSVSSIVRIEVPSGVLADLPGTGDSASGGQGSSGAGGSNTPDNDPGSAGGAGDPGSAGGAGDPGSAGGAGDPGSAGGAGDPGNAGDVGSAGGTGGSGEVTGDGSGDPDNAPIYGPAGPPRTLLLIGTDSAVGMDPNDPAAQRDTTSGVALADVIMLVRIDPGLRRAAVLSIPRDLYLPIYRDGVPVREEKLASALIVGGIGRGAPTLIETVSRNFNVPIHDFVVVDFAGFVQVIDELDGIPMWFNQPVRDVGSGLSIPESGCHVLDGSSSLAFVRSRKLEAFVGGRWRRVGVSNDLERNDRQQDFIILALERLVERGARSVLVRNDLIEAGVDSVILDERLTLRTLLDIGKAFSDFEPTDLERYSLPVLDDLVGDSMVLTLHDGDEAEEVFDVFRGVQLRPDQVEVVLVDGRAPEVVGAEEVPVADHLSGRGFLVEERQGERTLQTVIRVAPHRFDAAVLLAQNLSRTPIVEVVDGLGDSVELLLGDDFGNLVLAPRDRAVVEAEARAQLPGVLLEGEDAASVGRGWWSLPRISIDVDGRPPEGESCP